jgi:uncharacterized membrane protein YhaH (DUF805 family)
MGMFGAVGSVYANMFNFSGRARRAEYWWFFLFWIILNVIATGGLIYWLTANPEYMVTFRSEAAMQAVFKQYQDEWLRWAAYIFAGSFFFYWLPYLAVTVRRLHDTGRSGWWMFKPFLVGLLGAIGIGVLAAMTGVAGGSAEPPMALMLLSPTLSIGVTVWFYVVLCLPGTHGNNRFGPDPIPDRPPRESSHPALVKEMDEELGRMVADRRKEEFQDYYRARVLPAIERTKSARRV